MFGTLTLRGIQEKNIFVDENKNIYKICNSWIIPPQKIVRWVQLQKNNEGFYKLMRSINIEYINH